MNLSSVFKKKKANVFLDGFFYFMAIIIFIVIVVTGAYILNIINDDIQLESDMSNTSKQSLNDMTAAYPTWFDYGVAGIILLLWILVLVASYNIDTHPVFFFISVIALAVAIFAASQFMEAINDYFAEPEISSIYLLFPISAFITNNILTVLAIIGFSITLALWAKNTQ